MEALKNKDSLRAAGRGAHPWVENRGGLVGPSWDSLCEARSAGTTTTGRIWWARGKLGVVVLGSLKRPRTRGHEAQGSALGVRNTRPEQGAARSAPGWL